MNTKRFVTGSSIILAGWLGATFLNEVPSKRYPKLDRNPATAVLDEDFQPDLAPRSGPVHELPVSVSR
jgi:hypothetical protein